MEGRGETKLDCALAGELLPNYLDEELTEELAARVQAHLICCHCCAWEVESLRQSLLALRASAQEAAPSEEFRAQLRDRLRRDHRAAAANRPGSPPAARPAARGPVFVLDDPEEGIGNG